MVPLTFNFRDNERWKVYLRSNDIVYPRFTHENSGHHEGPTSYPSSCSQSLRANLKPDSLTLKPTLESLHQTASFHQLMSEHLGQSQIQLHLSALWASSVTWLSSVLKEGNEIKDQVQKLENTPSKIMFNAWALTWHFMILFCSLEAKWLLTCRWIVWFGHVQLWCVIFKCVSYLSVGILEYCLQKLLQFLPLSTPFAMDVTASSIKTWSPFPYLFVVVVVFFFSFFRAAPLKGHFPG